VEEEEEEEVVVVELGVVEVEVEEGRHLSLPRLLLPLL